MEQHDNIIFHLIYQYNKTYNNQYTIIKSDNNKCYEENLLISIEKAYSNQPTTIIIKKTYHNQYEDQACNGYFDNIALCLDMSWTFQKERHLYLLEHTTMPLTLSRGKSVKI